MVFSLEHSKSHTKNNSTLEYGMDVLLYQRIKIQNENKGSITIILPFICQNCGKCCTEIGFPIACARISQISAYLQIPEDRVLKSLGPTKKGGRVIYEKLKPCPFLVNALCSIYPVRTECCKTWPLLAEFKDYGLGCKAMHRIRELEEVMTKEKKGIISRSFAINLDEIHKVAVKVPKRVIDKFMESDPLPKERELFLKLNTPL